jgi:hypothetical protein
MFTWSRLITRIIEAIAVTVAIYLITRRTLQTAELVKLVAMIGLTFLILDLFAPQIALGARHGSGFGMGLQQVAGSNVAPMNRRYFEGGVVEGLTNPETYAEYETVADSPMKEAQVPSIILQQYEESPFETK